MCGVACVVQLCAESEYERTLLHGGQDDARRTFLDRMTLLMDRFEADGVLGNGHDANRNIEHGVSARRQSHELPS